jgi:hypothetical protein
MMMTDSPVDVKCEDAGNLANGDGRHNRPRKTPSKPGPKQARRKPSQRGRNPPARPGGESDNGESPSTPSQAWTSGGTLKAKKVTWLWAGRIPYGALTVLEGDKGAGKSSFASAIAAHVTGGPKLPNCKRGVCGHVLWLTLEEDAASMVLPRLKAAGVEKDRVHFLPTNPHTGVPRRITFPSELSELQKAIEETGAKVVILDPFTSFADEGLSLNGEQEGRKYLEPLASLAAKIGCAIILIRHLRKSRQGPAIDQGIGGRAIGATARAVLRVDRSPQANGESLLSVVACNLAPLAPTLRYTLESHGEAQRIRWRGESDLTAEHLAEGGGDIGERGALADAKAFLRKELEEKAVPVKQFERLADEAGIRPGTLRRAKESLRVESQQTREGEVSVWVW